MNNGNGVELIASNVLFYNNYIHVKGIAVASGIFTDQHSDNCHILFNSINITNSNSQSDAITIGDADNLEIKNNVFANNGGGYAIKMPVQPTGFQLDFNDYFTTGSQLAELNGSNIQQLSNWQSATGMDANSFSFNPYYMSATELRPFQRELNGAGIPITGVLFDIDNQIRDANAPDIGADEFMVDFGLIQLLSPDLHCELTANDTVTVQLKQFGDIPFTNIQLAYQVNGGTIFNEVLVGSIYNDIIYTFNQTQNLSGYGTYVFKVWLVNSFDDNVNNDTLIVERYSNPAPQISLNQTSGCSGTAIQYNAGATIAAGYIDYFYWDFGDGTSDTVQNPNHLFDTSGTYSVHLYVYSDVGCYSDTIFSTTVLTTPQADFSATDVCFGNAVLFNNLSTVSSGTMTFSWDFGDGSTSLFENPDYTYQASDTFTVMLSAMGNNGCADTMYHDVIVYPLPYLAFLNLPSSFCNNDTAMLLSIEPPGASVLSPAYSNGWLDPLLSNIGNNSISISYGNNFGCIDTLVENYHVYEAPVAEIVGLLSQYCISGLDPEIIGNPVGGVLTGPGIIGNQFSISNAGTGIHTICYSVTDINGCSDSMEQSVEIAEFNTFSLNFVVDSITCNGQSDGAIDLQVDFSVANYNQVEWSNGDVAEDISGLWAGWYEVTVSDSYGCTFSDSVLLSEPHGILISDSIIPPTCIFAEDAAIFVQASGGYPPYSFSWFNFEDTDSISNLASGTYSLEVIDTKSCRKDFILTIEPSELPCLEIPNVFSPNDDGINDSWLIDGIEYVPHCEIKILDRWGRTVFESLGYAVPWDGKYDNKPLQSDAYFYFIEYNNGAPPVTGKVSIVY